MPYIKSITVYPIKSCAGTDLDRCKVLADGLELDRQWMLIDEQGNFLSQRQLPVLALVKPKILPAEQQLLVSAPGMEGYRLPSTSMIRQNGERLSVPVWRDKVQVIDAGAEASQWFSELLGLNARLVRFDESAERQVDPAWTDKPATTRLTDGFPLLIIGQSSLDDLNGRLAQRGFASVEMNRFRPNVVIEGWDAFEEDYVERISITEAGCELSFRLCKPCTRCIVTTVDQRTGARRDDSPHEPLDTLSLYRRSERMDGGIVFGRNAVPSEGIGGVLEVRQEVLTEYEF
jgi:uncharacterized protein YcbX